MTQEQNEKLEQKAKDYIKPFAHQLHLGADEGLIMDLVGFAQTILDNPGEWGLYPPDPALAVLAEGYRRLDSENERLREALENQIKKLEEAVNVMKSAIQFIQKEIYREK